MLKSVPDKHSSQADGMRTAGTSGADAKIYPFQSENRRQVHAHGGVEHLKYRSRSYHHRVLLRPDDIDGLNHAGFY